MKIVDYTSNWYMCIALVDLSSKYRTGPIIDWAGRHNVGDAVA